MAPAKPTKPQHGGRRRATLLGLSLVLSAATAGFVLARGSVLCETRILNASGTAGAQPAGEAAAAQAAATTAAAASLLAAPHELPEEDSGTLGLAAARAAAAADAQAPEPTPGVIPRLLHRIYIADPTDATR